ncbi:MAG: outer membrane protein [Verrucomicrobiales bacterium]
MLRSYLTPLAFAVALSQTSLAGETSQLLSSKAVMPPIEETIEDPWDVDAWLDGWLLQLSVNVHQKSIGFDQKIFLGFDDIISNIDWMIPFGGDIRYGRFGFMPDFVGLKMSGASQTPAQLFKELDVGLKLWALNLVGYYRVVDQPDFSLDILGGARNLYVRTNLAFTGGPVGNNRGNLRAKSTSKIWDGVVGARVEGDFTDRIFYSVYGDVGAGDSELTWQVLASLGYQVSENFSAALGYRYLHYDAENAATAVDVTGSGPQITLKWDF